MDSTPSRHRTGAVWPTLSLVGNNTLCGSPPCTGGPPPRVYCRSGRPGMGALHHLSSSALRGRAPAGFGAATVRSGHPQSLVTYQCEHGRTTRCSIVVARAVAWSSPGGNSTADHPGWSTVSVRWTRVGSSVRSGIVCRKGRIGPKNLGHCHQWRCWCPRRCLRRKTFSPPRRTTTRARTAPHSCAWCCRQSLQRYRTRREPRLVRKSRMGNKCCFHHTSAG